MFSGVDDAEGLLCVGEFRRDGVVREVSTISDVDSRETCEETPCIANDFGNLWEPD